MRYQSLYIDSALQSQPKFRGWPKININIIYSSVSWLNLYLIDLLSKPFKNKINKMEISENWSNDESNKLELESLPSEVLYLILKLLGPNDLVTCYNTSEGLRNAVKSCKLISFSFLNQIWSKTVFQVSYVLILRNRVNLALFQKLFSLLNLS